MTQTHAKGLPVTIRLRAPGRWLLLASLVALCGTANQATSPRFWQVATQADLMKGEVDGLSVDDAGRLVLGPVVKTIYEGTVPFIWALAPGPDGAVFAGSGNNGQVWKIDAAGAATEFFKAKELEVHTMLVAPDGALMVGTSPDGKVYRIDATGRATVYFDPDDKYIWSLAIDAQGRLYVGTGDKGVIYRVTAAGKSEVFYRTQTKHVTSLAFERGGQLLASTDSPGRVLRIDSAGKAFALIDSPFREMRALRVGTDGVVYAAAVNGKSSGGDDRTPPVSVGDIPKASTGASVSTEIMSITVGDSPTVIGQPVSPGGPTQDKSASKGAVYRIDAKGGSEIIWESKDDIPFDIGIEEGGAVSIATGNGGKLLRVEGNPTRTTLVTRLGGQQITSMLTVGSVRYSATSNPAKIYALTGGRAAAGTYVSDVKDAGLVATWGTLSWRAQAPGTGRVRLFTRSGNTSAPDDTWSTWSGPYTQADGDATQNPAARYFQWKAELSATPADKPGPSLALVKVGYQQRNARPRVTAISVMPPGMVYQRPFPTGEMEIAGLPDVAGDSRIPIYSLPLGTAPPPNPGAGPALGRRIYQKGLQSITWKADDENDDRLSYDVLYRGVDTTDWKPLRRATSDQLLTWDTTSVPDGTYIIRIVASDQPGNPSGQALTATLDSDGVEVDNTPPSIAVTSVARDGATATIVIDVRDAVSPISRVEYSVDAGPWQTLAPADGIGDSRQARYTLRIDAAAAGRTVVRASDALNNTATLKVNPLVPGSAGK
jgi:hypothetical protein